MTRRVASKGSVLASLEADAVYIFREAVAQARRPVLLYSVGKDSSVLLHLARKAFHPGPVPFPLLHIDTGWKFREMYAFRDRVLLEHGLDAIVHRNEAAAAAGVNPFEHPDYTDVMKTVPLREALDRYGFDAAIGGARRDEERSRAKERVFSFRGRDHRWDPRAQRPELWDLYQGAAERGESVRVFPLSNWTEVDVWDYILQEGIDVVPLYLARERPVVERDGTLIMVDDERFPLRPGEQPQLRRVRFRTLGCYPLSGAVESDAITLEQVVAEVRQERRSERAGRLIDRDGASAMERRKSEGYF
jgi:sulfate adenylyltransferase subunit 2